MKKTTIHKTISIKKQTAKYENIDVSVGYSEEIEYETDEELNKRVDLLNKKINTEMKKSVEYLQLKYWSSEASEMVKKL
jgi:hypothetical protein